MSFLVTQRFDVLDRIDDVKIPVLLVHGTSDDIVPFAMGERLFAATKAAKRFFRAEGGSHHNLTANFFDGYQHAVSEHFGLNLKRVAQSVVPAAGFGAAVNADSATR